MKTKNEIPTDKWHKIIYFVGNHSGKPGWDYTLAYFEDGCWYDVESGDDYTNIVRFWDNVELPEEVPSYK